MNENEKKSWIHKWEVIFKDTPPWQLNGVNSYLEKHFKHFENANCKTVFVPLCGKTVDLIYFSKNKIDVVGVELSSYSIELFFQENNLKFTKEEKDDFIIYKKVKEEDEGTITIYCGDIFKLNIDPVDSIFDRASLYALGPEIREKYVEKILSLLKPNGIWFGLIYYLEGKTKGPPFSISVDQIKKYFNSYEINHVESDKEAMVNGDKITENVFVIKKTKISENDHLKVPIKNDE